MESRKITLTPLFIRDSKKLNKSIKDDIKFKLDKLKINPFHPDLKIKKLTGYKSRYRVVIIQNYRLIYTFNQDEIKLIAVKHRKDIYNSNF